MATGDPRRSGASAFVILRQLAGDRWQVLGEVPRRPGLTARAARSVAISEMTAGNAKAGEVYAAVLRSEWRVAQDWIPVAPKGSRLR